MELFFSNWMVVTLVVWDFSLLGRNPYHLSTCTSWRVKFNLVILWGGVVYWKVLWAQEDWGFKSRFGHLLAVWFEQSVITSSILFPHLWNWANAALWVCGEVDSWGSWSPQDNSVHVVGWLPSCCQQTDVDSTKMQEGSFQFAASPRNNMKAFFKNPSFRSTSLLPALFFVPLSSV